jgi:hypothetical protein
MAQEAREGTTNGENRPSPMKLHGLACLANERRRLLSRADGGASSDLLGLSVGKVGRLGEGDSEEGGGEGDSSRDVEDDTPVLGVGNGSQVDDGSDEVSDGVSCTVRAKSVFRGRHQ